MKLKPSAIESAEKPSALTNALLIRGGFLNTTEAAEFLEVSRGTLEVWRCTKRHSIPYIKIGRLVKYRLTDLEAWLKSQTIVFNSREAL